MNLQEGSTAGNVLKTFLLWLIPGIIAGAATALVLTVHEYHAVSELTGAVIESKSLPGGLKSALPEHREKGEAFLKSYGYDLWDNWSTNVRDVSGITVFLFQITGWILYFARHREEKRLERRINGLTEYLKEVDLNGGKVLSRTEDIFSHLEDEAYKTVMELKSTKESAVKDHELLAERIADIAHQLKTPLTSMSLMTELLEEHQTEETKEYYIRLSAQIERLKNLVSGLLALAKLDSHGIVFDRVQTDVGELLEESLEPLREYIERKGIDVKTERAGESSDSGPVCIYTDRQWTGEAILNILKNCAEHSPKGGRIQIVYRQNPLYAEVVVEDSGPGFLKKDLPHLFERFYKGKGSAKDSAGIGLALAKLVLEQQNGHIHAENTADGHARFRIKWYYL